MDELITRLNRVLADSYLFYLKTHFYHWNIKGPFFPAYHPFLGELYEEVYGSIDPLAEFIRALDGVPQNSPSVLKQNSNVLETNEVKPAMEMLADLHFDTSIIIKDILESASMADKFNEIGLSNFLQDRHAAFKKHAWMLNATINNLQ